MFGAYGHCAGLRQYLCGDILPDIRQFAILTVMAKTIVLRRPIDSFDFPVDVANDQNPVALLYEFKHFRVVQILYLKLF